MLVFGGRIFWRGDSKGKGFEVRLCLGYLGIVRGLVFILEVSRRVGGRFRV